MNFRALDPAYTAQGKVGMSANGQLEKQVWAEFHKRPKALARAAENIRSIIENQKLADAVKGPVDPADHEAQEGGLSYRLHRHYERDRSLVDKKRKQVLAADGSLACEVCEFDFGKRYGTHGDGFIEVHHKKPVHKIKPGEKTKLSDLAVLCANCHRMAHRGGALFSVDDLKAVLASASGK